MCVPAPDHCLAGDGRRAFGGASVGSSAPSRVMLVDISDPTAPSLAGSLVIEPDTPDPDRTGIVDLTAGDGQGYVLFETEEYGPSYRTSRSLRVIRSGAGGNPEQIDRLPLRGEVSALHFDRGRILAIAGGQIEVVRLRRASYLYAFQPANSIRKPTR